MSKKENREKISKISIKSLLDESIKVRPSKRQKIPSFAVLQNLKHGQLQIF